MESPTASFLKQQGDAVLLSVKVVPRASRNEIGEPQGDELKVRVTAPPVDSAANEALVRFIAEKTGVPRGHVKLVRGETSRHKLLRIEGLTIQQIAAALLPSE